MFDRKKKIFFFPNVLKDGGRFFIERFSIQLFLHLCDFPSLLFVLAFSRSNSYEGTMMKSCWHFKFNVEKTRMNFAMILKTIFCIRINLPCL